jgi:hypothetical protein
MYTTVNAIPNPFFQHASYPLSGAPDKQAYARWENSIKLTIDVQKTNAPHDYLFLGDKPSPIEMFVIDPDGHKSGYDQNTKNVIYENPNNYLMFVLIDGTILST